MFLFLPYVNQIKADPAQAIAHKTTTGREGLIHWPALNVNVVNERTRISLLFWNQKLNVKKKSRHASKQSPENIPKGWKCTFCSSSRDTNEKTEQLEELTVHCSEIFIFIFKDRILSFCCEMTKTLHLHPGAVQHSVNPPQLDSEQLLLILWNQIWADRPRDVP